MPETKRICPHCGDKVSETTFRRHKAQYFDQATLAWTQQVDKSQDFGSSESESEMIGTM